MNDALPYIMNVTDEQEWRTQAFPYIADAFIQSGGDPELVRRLDKMPMDQAKQVMQQMFDEATTKAPAKPSYETWTNTATGEKRTFDKGSMTEEDKAFMADQANIEKAPGRQITGTPADFSTNKIADEMAKAEAATTNFIADIYEAQDFVKSNPDALTTVAGMARVATNISANLAALRSSFGAEFENENIMDAENYAGTFKELGIASAEMKSIMIGLGMQQAIINNPDGRISGPDVKFAMEQIGTSIQTPEGFIRVSSRLANRADRVFKTRYKARSKGNKAFAGDLGARKSTKGKDISKMSLGDLRGIDRGRMTEEEKKQAFDRWEELKRVE